MHKVASIGILGLFSCSLSTWSIVNQEQWNHFSCFLSSECFSLQWPRLRLLPNWVANTAAMKEYVARMKKRAAQLGAVLKLLSAALKFRAVANILTAALKAVRPAVVQQTRVSAVPRKVAVVQKASLSAVKANVIKLRQCLQRNLLRCSLIQQP